LSEREFYGDLPAKAERLMKAYMYHYREEHDNWEPLHVEETFRLTFESGEVFEFKPDLILRERDTGLVGVWDHKNVRGIPSAEVRLSDLQSTFYPWGLENLEDPIGVDYFGFNYVRTKEPTVPSLNKDGSMSARKIDTDFLTLYNFVKDNDIPMTKAIKTRLKNLQTHSEFFRRIRLTKNDALVERTVEELLISAEEIAAKTEYAKDFPNEDPWVRNLMRDCDWCGFRDLCNVELLGGDTTFLRKKKYKASKYARRVNRGS